MVNVGTIRGRPHGAPARTPTGRLVARGVQVQPRGPAGPLAKIISARSPCRSVTPPTTAAPSHTLRACRQGGPPRSTRRLIDRATRPAGAERTAGGVTDEDQPCLT